MAVIKLDVSNKDAGCRLILRVEDPSWTRLANCGGIESSDVEH